MSNQLISYADRQSIIKTKTKFESSGILSWSRMHCQCAIIMSKKLSLSSNIIHRFASWIYAMIVINYNNSMKNHRVFQIQKLRRVLEQYCVARVNWIDEQMNDRCKHNRTRIEDDISREFSKNREFWCEM
jgi:precorrin-3B methylase